MWSIWKKPGLRDELKDPLDSLRKKLARIVEEKFRKNGEATLVIGCMHYPPDAKEPFVQTQTMPGNINPKNIARHESHLHPKAVTIDLRCSPEEQVEYPITADDIFFITPTLPQLHSHGPDFARRNFMTVSHIEDFKHVKGIKKIYFERIPDFEKGPASNNFDAFKAIYNLLDKGGILAFDFNPNYNIYQAIEHLLNIQIIAPYRK